MDLGVQIEPQFGFGYEQIRDIACDAERTGFRTLWVSDHLFLNKDAVATDCLEAWTVLAALAVDTTTIRIGPMVSCQSYRNPALLAKIAAGVDRMSRGRLEFGVGAGWKELEYRAYGFAFPENGRRVDELQDTLEICGRLWREDRVTFHGRRYKVDDAVCSPKPLQSPLPVWVGGRMPRVMRLAAKHAQAFNYLPSSGFPTPERSAEGMRLIDEACRSVKRDPATMVHSAFLYVCVTSTDREADAIVADLAAKAKLAPDAWRAARPGAMIGTPDVVTKALRAHAAGGVQHANVMFPYTHERAMVALMGEKVLPVL